MESFMFSIIVVFGCLVSLAGVVVVGLIVYADNELTRDVFEFKDC